MLAFATRKIQTSKLSETDIQGILDRYCRFPVTINNMNNRQEKLLYCYVTLHYSIKLILFQKFVFDTTAATVT
jgi:hypothetical protein